jgi:hypothetical protein
MDHMQRTFMTPTVRHSGVNSLTSWAGQLFQRYAPGLEWQQSHIFIQRKWWGLNSSGWYLDNPAARRGMMRLGNAGWNLMPLPARMNYYLNNHPWAAFGFGTGTVVGGGTFVGGSGYLGYRLGDWWFDE